ncbi:hypothetical protein NDU88_000527 [Pleurodeles waltl]|uniref:Uncharacterized protein n=1 Tax=Pleurodeles waltl TaxID=8319 RepID=A0AAV7URJ4_PLEWA|nr:hypothetical protein NDU88_000527 [Pleurodeles waltl]
MAGLGNPDIRVSQGVEKEEGQRAWEEGKKDGAVGEDGDVDGRDSTGKNIPDDEDRRLDKQSLSKPRGNPTEGQESPEQRRLRHVRGGTWLKQVRSCMKNRLIGLTTPPSWENNHPPLEALGKRRKEEVTCIEG